MHSEILNDRQRELLPLMAQFHREYYLVGGTAIALYLGHRRSIDFDLFKPGSINHKRNLDKIAATAFAHTVNKGTYGKEIRVADAGDSAAASRSFI